MVWAAALLKEPAAPLRMPGAGPEVPKDVPRLDARDTVTRSAVFTRLRCFLSLMAPRRNTRSGSRLNGQVGHGTR